MMMKLVDLLLLSCRCVVAVGWSAVCDCGYFLIILTYFLLQNYKISVVRCNPSKLFLLVNIRSHYCVNSCRDIDALS